MSNANQNGFTLVELSIVLVIIGLLIGAILVGSDLIKSAKVRRTVSQYEQIMSAVNTFRLKYNCLPADCSNVTVYFGQAPDNCVNTVNPGARTLTCNGDGNGVIGNAACDSNGFMCDVITHIPSTLDHEAWTFWQHLSNANLFPGTYSGTGHCPECYNAHGAKPGLNVPYVAMDQFSSTTTGYASIFEMTWMVYSAPGYKNTLVLGSSWVRTADGVAMGLVGGVLPREAFSIDKKLDDGAPTAGNILSSSIDLTCVSGTNYMLASNTGAGCAVNFKERF